MWTPTSTFPVDSPKIVGDFFVSMASFDDSPKRCASLPSAGYNDWCGTSKYVENIHEHPSSGYFYFNLHWFRTWEFSVAMVFFLNNQLTFGAADDQNSFGGPDLASPVQCLVGALLGGRSAQQRGGDRVKRAMRQRVGRSSKTHLDFYDMWLLMWIIVIIATYRSKKSMLFGVGNCWLLKRCPRTDSTA